MNATGKLRVLDLFSGVGAYSLGLERTGGFQTVAFCEIDPFARRILRKNWPDVPIYEDVRVLTGGSLRDAGIVPQWIVAGWPCQDISVAGTGVGLDGARSGLWDEIARLAGETGAEGLLLENSSNLLAINGGADFGRVLGDLAALGYDAEWHCLPAAAFDAPHIRDRLWIVAHRRGAFANHERMQGGQRSFPAEVGRWARETEQAGMGGGGQGAGSVADANDNRQSQSQGRVTNVGRRLGDETEAGYASHPLRSGLSGLSGLRGSGGVGEEQPGFDGLGPASHAHGNPQIGPAIARQERHAWGPEPNVVRVVHGPAAGPHRAARIKALGNLNPPIIPEIIGRAILQSRSAA